ncbi:MAG: pyridoxal phosphate-dependent aminotransferase [Rhodocyclaceae bacterium]|nr:MAG: pyridoxal phosphate-dependent aminotransferase [Rhodocyclaceae bacterium]
MKHFSEASKVLEGQQMFQILSQARQLEQAGRDIVHFEIGDPDFDTPPNIVEKCIEALRRGDTHYTNSSGTEGFKRAAADITQRSRGFRPSHDQILVTQGGNVQIYYALACTVNPGEEVVTVDPCFVSYRSIMKLLGIVPVGVPLYEENQFELDPADLEKAITPKTRMILINSPHNPTGAVLGEAEMKAIYDIAEKYDLYLLSDEVYGRMVYEDADTKFASPSVYDQCKERTIIVHSFSKSYAMTGWRIGAMTAPADLVARMQLLLETTTSCVSPFIQAAAIEAMTASQSAISAMMQEYRQRRDLMVGLLNQIRGVSCQYPKGAFYAFANVKKSGMTDREFADHILQQAGVTACPGSFFGRHGEGYVRFCFANSSANIQKGMDRLLALFQ